MPKRVASGSLSALAVRQGCAIDCVTYGWPYAGGTDAGNASIWVGVDDEEEVGAGSEGNEMRAVRLAADGL